MEANALKAHYFPKLAEGQNPELAEVRTLIVNLDAAGRRAEAEHLMEWYDKLKNQTNAEGNRKARKKLIGNIAYVVLIVLIVVTGILASIYFLNRPHGGSSEEIIVCSVKGEIREGSDCDLRIIPGADFTQELSAE